MEFKVERVKIKGILLRDLLNPHFIEQMEKAGFDMDYVHLVGVSKQGEKGDKGEMTQISFFHSNDEDVKTKQLHIDSEGEDHIDKIKTVLEKIHKK